MTIDHESLSRWSTVPTPTRDTSNSLALLRFFHVLTYYIPGIKVLLISSPSYSFLVNTCTQSPVCSYENIFGRWTRTRIQTHLYSTVKLEDPRYIFFKYSCEIEDLVQTRIRHLRGAYNRTNYRYELVWVDRCYLPEYLPGAWVLHLSLAFFSVVLARWLRNSSRETNASGCVLPLRLAAPPRDLKSTTKTKGNLAHSNIGIYTRVV